MAVEPFSRTWAKASAGKRLHAHSNLKKKTYRLGCATQTSVQDKLGMHRKRVDEVDSHPVREVDTSLDACSDARLHSKAMPSNVL